MKKRSISVCLTLLAVITIIVSACFMSVSSCERKWGIPVYTVQRFDCAIKHGSQETEVKFNPINMIVFFCVMNVPVFFAGYLWARGSLD